MSLRFFLQLILGSSLFGCANMPAETSVDFNSRILTAMRIMPSGGGYNGSDQTKNLLPKACRLQNGTIEVDANMAKPSFCSSATYLVLLKALRSGSTELLPTVDHQDGHGVFGRWNANGPGAAKLVSDLAAGNNFTDWEKAKPGDFLKIWWAKNIGGRERGHLVIYLSHTESTVTFWSSNQPNGYGTKTIPREKCERALFTRITRPERFAQAGRLPKVDPWLVRMLREDFTWDEVLRKCRVDN